MRLVKIIATIVFSLIIIIAIGGYIAVRNFDLNKYKPYVEELAEKSLGRKLTINGEAYLGISLKPTVIVNDVTLANASWAKAADMVKVKQLEVKFALLPLLKKQIQIDNVLLDGAEVYLEKAADGKANWDFNGQSAEAVAQQAAQKAAQENLSVKPADIQIKDHPEMAFLAGFAAKNVNIEKGLVEYYDAKSKQTTSAAINKLTMQAPGIDEEMNADFDVTVNGQKVKGKLTLGALKTLLENREPYPFSLTAEALGINIKANGSAEDVMKQPRYAVQTNIYNPAGNLKAPETTLKARIDGDLTQANADIEVLNIVNNLITGKAKVNWSGSVPSIDAVLRSDKINLQNFSQNSNFAVNIPSFIGEAQALEIVPATAIPYKELKSVNAKADVTIGTLVIAPGMQADNVSLKANLQNGVLNVNPLKLKFGGGEINATATVNASAQSVQLKATSQNMKLQNLHNEFVAGSKGKFGVLTGGNVDLDIDVKGSGSTYRQLVNSLQGSVIAIVDKSVLQTGSLKFMTGNFLTQLLTTMRIDTSKTSQLDLNCAVVRADLGGGKAVFPKGIALSSQQVNLVSDGNINLENDKINFTVKPFSGKVVDTNVVQALSSLVKIAGTIEQPKIALDDKEALKTIVGVAATGGTAYLGSKLLLDADSSPCYTALQGTPYASRFPKPSGVQAAGQDVYQGTVGQVDKGLKDIKDAAKDFLNAFKKPKNK